VIDIQRQDRPAIGRGIIAKNAARRIRYPNAAARLLILGGPG